MDKWHCSFSKYRNDDVSEQGRLDFRSIKEIGCVYELPLQETRVAY